MLTNADECIRQHTSAYVCFRGQAACVWCAPMQRVVALRKRAALCKMRKTQVVWCADALDGPAIFPYPTILCISFIKNRQKTDSRQCFSTYAIYNVSQARACMPSALWPLDSEDYQILVVQKSLRRRDRQRRIESFRLQVRLTTENRRFPWQAKVQQLRPLSSPSCTHSVTACSSAATSLPRMPN
jgi:hypothetical protein